MGLLPNFNQWWDPEKKMDYDVPQFGYPQYSSKSLREIMKMGMKIRSVSRKSKPAAKKVYGVINDHDESVDNELCQQLVNNWQGAGAVNIETYHFPDELGIPHDCISIEQPQAKTKVVYSVLLKMVNGKEVK